MIGTTKGMKVVDGLDVRAAFENAFGARVISYSVSTQHSPIYSLGMHSPVSLGPDYTINIACNLENLPIDRSLMDYFSMVEEGHYLLEVKHNIDGRHIHTIELTYRVSDVNKFFADIENYRYKRFCKDFQKDLEEHLD